MTFVTIPAADGGSLSPATQPEALNPRFLSRRRENAGDSGIWGALAAPQCLSYFFAAAAAVA